MTPIDDHAAHVLRELARHMDGAPTRLFRSAPGAYPVGCAYFAPEATGRPFGTLATFGMSRSCMTMDARATDTDLPRTELVAYVDEGEPLLDALAAHLLYVASYPFVVSPPTFLGWGHTIPFGEPLFPGSLLTTVLTLIPLVRVDKGEIFRVEDDPVSLTWTTFLTDAEYALKKARGENAILDLFAEHRHPLTLAAGRRSYV